MKNKIRVDYYENKVAFFINKLVSAIPVFAFVFLLLFVRPELGKDMYLYICLLVSFVVVVSVSIVGFRNNSILKVTDDKLILIHANDEFISLKESIKSLESYESSSFLGNLGKEIFVKVNYYDGSYSYLTFGSNIFSPAIVRYLKFIILYYGYIDKLELSEIESDHIERILPPLKNI
ncbi:MAG: hypothetical protein ACQETE_09325 [Bacteroidota bacterium]